MHALLISKDILLDFVNKRSELQINDFYFGCNFKLNFKLTIFISLMF